MRFGVSTWLAALLKADGGGLFGAMAPHAGPRHPPLTSKIAADGTQLVLLRSRENPSQMRWQRADHGGSGAMPSAPAEAARQVLREANRPGGLALTRARLENPDVHALVAKGYLVVHPAPAHHLAEFHAEITRAGREWIERFDQMERVRAAGTQQALFKGRLGVRIAVLRALRKAEQLRLFGFEPVHVHGHLAHNPGGVGSHVVLPHQRHVDHHPNLPPARDTTGVVPAAAPGAPPTPPFAERAADPTPAAVAEMETADLVPAAILAPGELLEAHGVAVDLPEAVNDSTANVRARRGKTYHELGSSPGEWRPADVEGFAETTNAKGEIIGMPVFDLPSDYQPVKTRFSSDGPGEAACELCGTPIKNVAYIVNDKRKLSMMVGCKCVEAHGEALMPGGAKLAVKTFSTRLKPEEIAPTNALIGEGVPATVAAARVRARLGAGERFDRANPPPTEEQHRFWERTRARVNDIVRRRSQDGYVSRGDYEFAFGPGYERHYASSQEPKPPSMLAQEIRERADIPAPGLRRKAEREGKDPWPAGWDASARAQLEELEGMSAWPAAGEAGLDLHAVRDAFFPHLLVRDLHHAVSRRVAPDWAETGRSLHETRAAKRQEAVDKAERKVVVETHPTIAKLAALGEKVSSATPWTDEEQAWVATELAAMPVHKRPKGDSRMRKIEALTVHHDARLRLEPLRKAAIKNKPGLHLDPTIHRWVLDDPKAGKLVAAVVHAPLDHEAMAKAYGALWKHNPRQAAGALSHSMHAMHPDFPAPDPTSENEANNRTPHGVAGALRRIHARGNLELWHQGFQNLAAHWAGDGAEYAAKRKAHVDGEKAKQAELDAYEGQGVEPDAGTPLSKLRGKKVWLYHGTSDAFLDDIRQYGLRSGREVGKQSNFGSARNPHKIQDEVYLTSDSGRGPAGAWDYARLAATRHGGSPVVLRVLVDGDMLSHDRDDADLRSGASQYRIPRVEPHQVKEVHGDRVAWGADPLRKAAPARFTVPQLHAAARTAPPPPAVPPEKHVRYHHPDTGEERTGQVISGGAQGITVADHETGQTAKVHHGHYVVADAPAKPGKAGASGGKTSKPDQDEPRKLRADTRDAGGRSLHDRLEEVGRRLPDYRAAVASHRRARGSAAEGRAEAAEAAERSTGPVSPETDDYVRRHLGGDVGLDDLRAFRASRLFAEHAAEHGDERAAAEHVSKELGAGRRAARAHHALHTDPHDVDQELVTKHGGRVTMHGSGRAVGFHREADRDAYVKAAKGAKKLPAGKAPNTGAEDVHDAEPMLDRHVAPSVVAAHRAGKRMSKSKPGDTDDVRERRFAEHLGQIGKHAPAPLTKGLRFLVRLSALRKAAQLGLFGGETPIAPRSGRRPKPVDDRQGSLFAPLPPANASATVHTPEQTMSSPVESPTAPPQPPAGYVPIPGTQHGGWRQAQPGGGYRYWYPDSPGVGHASPKPEDQEAVAALDAPAPAPTVAPLSPAPEPEIPPHLAKALAVEARHGDTLEGAYALIGALGESSYAFSVRRGDRYPLTATPQGSKRAGLVQRAGAVPSRFRAGQYYWPSPDPERLHAMISEIAQARIREGKDPYPAADPGPQGGAVAPSTPTAATEEPRTLSLPKSVWTDADVREFVQLWERPVRWVAGDRFEITSQEGAKGMIGAIREWATPKMDALETERDRLRGTSYRGKIALNAQEIERIARSQQFADAIERALVSDTASAQIGVGATYRGGLPTPGRQVRRDGKLFVITSVSNAQRTEDGRSFGHDFDEGWVATAQLRPATAEENAEADRRQADAAAARAKQQAAATAWRAFTDAPKEHVAPTATAVQVAGGTSYDSTKILVDGDHFYLLSYNGRDGDDWSANNHGSYVSLRGQLTPELRANLATLAAPDSMAAK